MSPNFIAFKFWVSVLKRRLPFKSYKYMALTALDIWVNPRRSVEYLKLGLVWLQGFNRKITTTISLKNNTREVCHKWKGGTGWRRIIEIKGLVHWRAITHKRNGAYGWLGRAASMLRSLLVHVWELRENVDKAQTMLAKRECEAYLKETKLNSELMEVDCPFSEDIWAGAVTKSLGEASLCLVNYIEPTIHVPSCMKWMNVLLGDCALSLYPAQDRLYWKYI